MNNKFFKVAIGKATTLIRNPKKLTQLATGILHVAKSIDPKSVSFGRIRDKLFVLVRLTKAYASGRYRVIPLKTLVSVVAALVYFLNPLDLIPDFVAGVGLLDDLTVMTWVFRMTKKEIDKFVLWESEAKERVIAIS